MKIYTLVFNKTGNGWADILDPAGRTVASAYLPDDQEAVLELLSRANALSQFSWAELNQLLSEAYCWRHHLETLKKQQQEDAAKSLELLWARPESLCKEDTNHE